MARTRVRLSEKIRLYQDMFAGIYKYQRQTLQEMMRPCEGITHLVVFVKAQMARSHLPCLMQCSNQMSILNHKAHGMRPIR